MAGRKPNITHDNKISKQSKDKINALEKRTPVYKSQEFKAPKSLSKEELEIWEWLVSIVRETEGSYISDADIMTMEIFCKAKAEYDHACEQWANNPEYYVKIKVGEDKNGAAKEQIKVNQFYQIKKDFSVVMLKYLTELGISPIGRAKQGLQATKSEAEKNKDKVMDLFNRKGD